MAGPVVVGDAADMTLIATLPADDRIERRPALSPAERRALAIVSLGLGTFATLGARTGASGTLQYLLVVAALSGLIAVVRRRPLPDGLAIGLSLLAWSHLAGGLVRVGDSVLYNADPGTELLQYDHLGHFAGILLGTLTIWELCIAAKGVVPARSTVVLCVLAGLGLGAINEAVEFVATLVQDASHVGGYHNTGWDLVTNSVAGVVAGVVLSQRNAADTRR